MSVPVVVISLTIYIRSTRIIQSRVNSVILSSVNLASNNLSDQLSSINNGLTSIKPSPRSELLVSALADVGCLVKIEHRE